MPPVWMLQGETSVEAVKYQVTRLMRMLVQICQTLDKVPQEVRWASASMVVFGGSSLIMIIWSCDSDPAAAVV